MKVLAIAGSLRAASINAVFCRAAARLAPIDLEIEVFTGIVTGASVTLPLLGAIITEEAMVQSPAVSSRIQGALASLHAFLLGDTAVGPSFPFGPP